MKNWNNVYMEVAQVISQRSTCCKHNVGAVITKDNKVISCGYNGVVSGARHCTEIVKGIILDSVKRGPISLEPIGGITKLPEYNIYIVSFTKNIEYRIKVPKQPLHVETFIYNTVIENDYIKEWHHKWSKHNEVHAELNAILNATQSVKGSSIYITLSPCIDCARAIVASGIKRVYFTGEDRKHKDDDGIEFLEQNKIEVYYIK